MSKTFTYGLVPPGEIMSRSGLSFLTEMIEGKVPQPPICATLGFHLAEASQGFACFEGVPEQRHYNPIGTVHGGFAATLLDSCMGLAVQSTLEKGVGQTTLEFKISLLRPITPDTGPIRAEGLVLSHGRRIGTAEGRITDRHGKLLAHGTTTCLIFER